jgi:hypothetical protein
VNVAILDKWSLSLCWWYEQYFVIFQRLKLVNVAILDKFM